MMANVLVIQGYHTIGFKFEDEMSAIQFASICKEHVINPVDRDNEVIPTNVSVILDPDEGTI